MPPSLRIAVAGLLILVVGMKRKLRIAVLIGTWFITVLLWSGQPSPVLASGPIVLDSVFTDWAGQGNIADESGDAIHDKWDITKFWWAENVDGSHAYWRVDRVSSSKKVTYVLHIDTNNNGDFNDNIDREVVVAYTPRDGDSHVDVRVRYGDTQVTISGTKKNDWGESVNDGGRYVEFMASFADLGLNPNQVIRVYVSTLDDNSEKDRAPDVGDIQWSVVNVLGYPLLAGLMVGASLLFWRMRGRCSCTTS